MSKKINLGILFGGRSCEHEVSVVSAQSVLNAIDPEKYTVHLIGIDKQGHWHLGSDIDQLIENKEVKSLGEGHTKERTSSNQITLGLHYQGNLEPISETQKSLPSLDVIFPILHGTFGEDGTLQGLLELAGIPYVGCGVAASSIAMDKALAKQIFSAAGIPQSPCTIVRRADWQQDGTGILNHAEAELGFPMFVKPANMGSSVGVSKAHDMNSLKTAITDAFQYDNKIVIEQSMENCQEVECAVLGNENPTASVVGEIIPGAEFYDYQTKYIDDKTETLIPARISEPLSEKVRSLSITAFKAIDGSGLSRVDFFANEKTGEVFLNEINTLPGFTPISMYPQLWAASGITYPALIDQLIDLAIDQHRSKLTLKRAL